MAFIGTETSGTAPSTGQTVGFIEVGSGAGINIPTLAGANTAILWGAVKSGNIPYNVATGQFTLTAGKTYKIEAETAQPSTSIYWWNATTNTTLNTNTAGSNTTYSGEAKTIFTPSVTTLIELRGSSASYNAGNGDGGLSTKANIVQIGSTSNTVGTLPANDQSSTGYFDIGNMRLQWGRIASTTDDDQVVTFPVPFAGVPAVQATFAVTNGATFSTGVGVNATGIKNVTVSSFIVNRDDNIQAGDLAFINYFAQGQKP